MTMYNYTWAYSMDALTRFWLRNVLKNSGSYRSNVAAGPPKMTLEQHDNT